MMLGTAHVVALVARAVLEGPSPTQLMAAQRLAQVCLGIFVCEFAQTVWFEWWLVRRRRKLEFKWPYIFYLLGRYCTLAMLACCATVKMSASDHRSCTIYGLVMPLLGFVAIGCSSLNLALRAYATATVSPQTQAQASFLRIARQHNAYRKLTPVLITIGLCHWGILAFGVHEIHSNLTWNGSCPIGPKTERQLALVFVYTVVYNALAMALSAEALRKMNPSASTLHRILVGQGLGYFVVAFLANLIPGLVALFPSTSIWISLFIPATTTTSTIASSRLVTQLLQMHASAHPPHHSLSTRARGAAGRTPVEFTSQFAIPMELSYMSDGTASRIPTRSHSHSYAKTTEREARLGPRNLTTGTALSDISEQARSASEDRLSGT